MSKLVERERDRAAAAVISDLRWLMGQWSPAAGDHAAELWADKLDGALWTLRHAIDDEWEGAVAWRGSDELCDAAWPSTGIKRSDSRWEADRWCRIVLGVLRNRPEEFEDPYDAVLGVGLWIVGKAAEPTEQDWARWTEANAAAVTAIADMLTSQPDGTHLATTAATDAPLKTAASSESFTHTQLAEFAECSGDTVSRVRDEAGLLPGKRGLVRNYSSSEVGQLVKAAAKHSKWKKHAAAWRQLTAKTRSETSN